MDLLIVIRQLKFNFFCTSSNLVLSKLILLFRGKIKPKVNFNKLLSMNARKNYYENFCHNCCL